MAVVIFATVSLVAIVVAWARVEWELEWTSKVGDTVAPLGAVLTAGALGAALWTVRVQRISVDAQIRELTETRHAFQTQVAQQRTQELRAGYARWLREASVCLAATSRVADWFTRLGTGENIHTLEKRKSPRDEALVALQAVQRERWALELLEPDAARRERMRGLSAFDEIADETKPWPATDLAPGAAHTHVSFNSEEEIDEVTARGRELAAFVATREADLRAFSDLLRAALDEMSRPPP